MKKMDLKDDARKLVSVIIINYNNTKDTIECIDSLIDTNSSIFNIVVVDNNSKCGLNDLIDYCGKFNFIKLIKNKFNDGFASGNNIGIKYAKKFIHPDYIILLNNDTIVRRDFFEKIFNIDEKFDVATVKILYASKDNIIWYAGGDLNTITGRTVHYGLNENDKKEFDVARDVTFASGCCLIINLRVIEKIGLLSEDYFMYEEDTDYCYKIISNNYKIKYIPNAVIYHKVGMSSKGNSIFSQYYMVRNKFIFINKYFKNPNKLIANIYFICKCIKDIAQKKLSIRIFLLALEAYKIGEIGKSSNI